MGEIGRHEAHEMIGAAIEEALKATAGELAKVNPERVSTAPSPEMIDLVKLLTQIDRRTGGLPQFCLKALGGEVEVQEWQMLAKLFAAVSGGCQRQGSAPVVIEGT